MEELIEAVAELDLARAADLAASSICGSTSLDRISEVIDLSVFFADDLAQRLDDATCIRLLESQDIDRQALSAVIWARTINRLVFDCLHATASPLSQCSTDLVLLTALRSIVVDDAEIERVLRLARQQLLNRLLAAPSASIEPSLLEFIDAFAAQCRLNPWIWGAGPAEELELGRLIHRLSGADVQSVRSLFPEVPAHAGAAPATVRQHYEGHPYPVWRDLPLAREVTLSDRLRSSGRFVDPDGVAPAVRQPTVLIAGSGTGQHALRFKRSTESALVVGLDLSTASLRFAVSQARLHGLTGCFFCQGDLGALPFGNQSFDVIECVGVLHHLEDPLNCLRELRRTLSPDGRICLGVYSTAARSSVASARAVIAESEADLVAQRAHLMDLPPDHPAAAVRSSVDFYTREGFIDLLFPASETTYCIESLRELVHNAGLSVVAVEYPHPALTRVARRLAEQGLQPLDAARAVEEAIPEAFSAMYILWVADAAQIGEVREG